MSRTPQATNILYQAVATGLEIEQELTLEKKGGLAYVLMRARRGAAEALKALIDVDPGDEKGIRKVQSEIRFYREMTQFIDDAMEEAKAANFQLDHDEAEELEAWRNDPNPENDL